MEADSRNPEMYNFGNNNYCEILNFPISQICLHEFCYKLDMVSPSVNASFSSRWILISSMEICDNRKMQMFINYGTLHMSCFGFISSVCAVQNLHWAVLKEITVEQLTLLRFFKLYIRNNYHFISENLLGFGDIWLHSPELIQLVTPCLKQNKRVWMDFEKFSKLCKSEFNTISCEAFLGSPNRNGVPSEGNVLLRRDKILSIRLREISKCIIFENIIIAKI